MTSNLQCKCYTYQPVDMPCNYYDCIRQKFGHGKPNKTNSYAFIFYWMEENVKVSRPLVISFLVGIILKSRVCVCHFISLLYLHRQAVQLMLVIHRSAIVLYRYVHLIFIFYWKFVRNASLLHIFLFFSILTDYISSVILL